MIDFCFAFSLYVCGRLVCLLWFNTETVQSFECLQFFQVVWSSESETVISISGNNVIIILLVSSLVALRLHCLKEVRKHISEICSSILCLQWPHVGSVVSSLCSEAGRRLKLAQCRDVCPVNCPVCSHITQWLLGLTPAPTLSPKMMKC